MRLFISKIGQIRVGKLLYCSRSTLLAFMVIANATYATTAQDTTPPLVQPGAPGQQSKMLTPAESVALGQSRYTDADVSFMQNMIVHHSQAVDMGALIPDRTQNQGVRYIGERIALTQTGEIEMMRTWLRRRGHSLEMQEGHNHHGGHVMQRSDDPNVPLMHGMLSPNQMKQLAASKGAEFNRLFLTGMIEHHQGAIDMVNALLVEKGAGEDPEISEFLASIVADQSTEILRMRSMLAER